MNDLFVIFFFCFVPAWTEDVAAEDQTSVVLNHYELYDYDEEAANW